MKLLYSFSVPILSYAIEVKQYPSTEMHNCHVALNDAIRRIFSFNRWESIRHLRESFGFPDLTTIFASKQRSFRARITSIGNDTIRSLVPIFSRCTDSH